MIAYSPDAEPARAFLLKRYNDLDVYVEDLGCQNLYIRLINRMLDGRAKISHVYPLGGRDGVLTKCRQDQVAGGRNRIYLIDADFDLFLGKPAPRLKRLHRINAYCVENLLLTPEAIVELGTECVTNMSHQQIESLIDAPTFIAGIVSKLLPLFIVYAVFSKLKMGVETVNFPVHRLLDQAHDPHSLSEKKIGQRIFSMLRIVAERGMHEDYKRARDDVQKRLDLGLISPEDAISGKSYLLPLVHLLLKDSLGFTDKQDRLKVRLATFCSLDRDRKLKLALRRAAA